MSANGIYCRPNLAGTMNWEVLKEAFKDYERSNKHKEIHASCQSMYNRKSQMLTWENFRQTINQLLDESLGLDICKSGSRE